MKYLKFLLLACFTFVARLTATDYYAFVTTHNNNQYGIKMSGYTNAYSGAYIVTITDIYTNGELDTGTNATFMQVTSATNLNQYSMSEQGTYSAATNGPYTVSGVNFSRWYKTGYAGWNFSRYSNNSHIFLMVNGQKAGLVFATSSLGIPSQYITSLTTETTALSFTVTNQSYSDQIFRVYGGSGRFYYQATIGYLTYPTLTANIWTSNEEVDAFIRGCAIWVK